MAIKTGLLFCTLLLGSLAIPVPDVDHDMSIFFVNADLDGPEDRIVGGSVAPNGAHPWMVAFTIGGNARYLHCGGSILTQRTVLTAAHCIDPVRVGNTVMNSMRVSVGSNRFNSGGQVLTINGAVMHPQYNFVTIKNDVGTMFTASNMVFNNLVRAIPQNWDHIGAGLGCRVAGWGRTSTNGPVAAQLMQLDVNTIDGNRCVTDARQAAITHNMRAPAVDPRLEICTFHSPGRGTCRGDSGSALVRRDRNQQIAIVSWGFPCALGAPDIYVRNSAYRTWIQRNTR